MDTNLKQITEILHTIFCRRKHEDDMLQYEGTKKCCYYLEQTIEDTWSQRDHALWTEQAEVFIQLSKDGIGMLNQMVMIYKAAEVLRNANPLYLKYVEVLLNVKGEEK